MNERPIDADLRAKTARLAEILGEGGRTLLAYSGGVDSALLAVICAEQLGDAFCAVLADSPSLSAWEKDEALQFAADQGIDLRVVTTREMESEGYRRNSTDRCFHCKAELFGVMEGIAAAEGFDTLLYGGNSSDRFDDRPGERAARKFRARAPLAEAGIGKEEIRRLARARGLSVWDKPARACLASRIPHGSPVDARKLEQVERAETLLHELGFRDFRVRHHGAIARIEVGESEWRRFGEGGLRRRINEALRGCGFTLVALDLEAFATGRLSRLAKDPNLTDDSVIT